MGMALMDWGGVGVGGGCGWRCGRNDNTGGVVLAVEGESESECESEGRGECEGACVCAYDEWGFTWAHMARTWFKHASGSWVAARGSRARGVRGVVHRRGREGEHDRAGRPGTAGERESGDG